MTTKNDSSSFASAIQRRHRKLGISKTNPEKLTNDEIIELVRLDIDPESILWNRTLDCNDKFYRNVIVGQDSVDRGYFRHTSFDLNVSSECLDVLNLANALQEMQERLRKIVIVTSRNGDPITCKDIGCADVMAELLQDAIEPTFLQALKGTPAFVHAGLIKNISIGYNNILASK